MYDQIKASVNMLHLCDGRSHCTIVPHIASLEGRSPRRRTRHIQRNRARALLLQASNDGGPDCAGSTGHDGNLVFESALHATTSVRRASTRWRYAPQSAAPIAPA